MGKRRRFHIDRMLSFDDHRREVGVVGWACLDDLTSADEMWAEVDGNRAPCLTGVTRPDVARIFNARALEKAGFVCRFPVSRDVAHVELIAYREGEQHVIGTFASPRSVVRPQSEKDDYSVWLSTHESQLYWKPSDVERRLRTLTYLPVISVILPTYNTHLYHLHRCIESVTAQLYPHWELCVTDDASPDARIRPYLLERAVADRRIQVSFCEQRAGISSASNRSIAAATGDFILLIDHDDELHPQALLEVARRLNAFPDTDVIYSDEDKIDQVGVRSSPAFKPEFDEDLLCGFNYLGHLVSMRTALVRQVGGFRSSVDGAQDWDLLLRVTSAISPRRISHIPKPLYHWRMHEDSTAFSLDAKPYAIRAWNAVLSEHVSSTCSVRDGLFLGSMRILRQLPDDTRVSILCRACDGPHQMRALNRSRAAHQVKFFEVLLSAIRRIEHPESCALMTVEDLESDVTIVVSCRLDSVNHFFLEELAAQALRPDCGVAGGTIVDARGAVLTAGQACLSDGTHLNPFEGLALHELGYMGQARVVRAVPSIGPQVFAFRTSRLLDVHGLACISEDSLSEVCASLVRSAHAKGLKVLHTPYAIATLRGPVRTYEPRQSDLPPCELMVNPNIEQFSNVNAVLKGGFH
jgi:hypothetical protein